MNNIAFTGYWKEIDSICTSMADEALSENDNDQKTALDDIFDSRLHETIDGHRWIIYNAYNLDVIEHSANGNYYKDSFGCDDIAAILKEGGISKLHTVMAYYSMYGDVSDRIGDTLDALTEKA